MIQPYHVANIVSLALIGVALGFCFSWQDRKGKTWFLAFLAMLFAGRLAFIVGMMLFQTVGTDHSSWSSKILMAVSGFGGILSLIFLLIFVIVSRNPAPADIMASSGKVGEEKWSWSMIKGLVWALPVGAGALLGVKKVMAYSIAFNNDYSLLFLVFIVAGLALWLGGFRRISRQHAEQEEKEQRP